VYSSPVRTYFRCDRDSFFRMELGVSEGGDTLLVYGSEVYEEHV